MEFVVAQNPAQFQEPKKRNESAKYDDTAREQVFDAHIVECSGYTISMHESFDRFLNNVKAEDQQAKQKRFIKG